MHIPLPFLLFSSNVVGSSPPQESAEQLMERLRGSLKKLRKTLSEVSDESDVVVVPKRTSQEQTLFSPH